MNDILRYLHITFINFV